MDSAAAIAFRANAQDVSRLAAIHTTISGSNRGRKRGVSVLNRSAIVFVTACWQAYIEDVLQEAVRATVLHANSQAHVTPEICRIAGKEITAGGVAAEIACWNGATAGWQTLLTRELPHVWKEWIEPFSTPRPAKIDKRFDVLLGLANLSSNWYWAGMSAAKAGLKLEKYLSVRHDIAHRGAHRRAVHKTWPRDYLAHVERLVLKTDAKVRAAVHATVGVHPW